MYKLVSILIQIQINLKIIFFMIIGYVLDSNLYMQYLKLHQIAL